MKKVQEQMLEQLYLIREQFVKDVESICNSGQDSASSEEVKKLRDENKKLKYRITHLLRALDEKDGIVSAQSGSVKLYTVTGSTDLSMQQIKLVAKATGFNLDV